MAMGRRQLVLGSSGDSDSEASNSSWIPWFCSKQQHDFFAEVDENYILDSFNLYGLRNAVPNFDQLIRVITGRPPTKDELKQSEYLQLHNDAVVLYGLIHARYIISPPGLVQMRDKYLRHSFGVCPRVLCHDQRALPAALSDEPKRDTIRLFCPNCQELYRIPDDNIAGHSIDGSFFGTGFPHILLQSFPELVPLNPIDYYEPKIFGFSVYNVLSIVKKKAGAGEYGQSQMSVSKHNTNRNTSLVPNESAREHEPQQNP